jgi:chromosomal replication initiator protein
LSFTSPPESAIINLSSRPIEWSAFPGAKHLVNRELRLTATRLLSTPENRSALAAVQHVAACLGAARGHRIPNPLYLHGPAGSGKTHLLEVLTEEVIRRLPHASITRGWSERPIGSAFQPEDFDSDLFLLEDLQHLDSRAAAALTGLFDHRQARQRQMVFTATVGPAELELPARLVSRLASGLVVGVEALQASSRLAVLEEKAQARQLAVRRDILVWLAEHLTGGRQLEGAIAKLELLGRLQDGLMDLATVVPHFHDLVEANRPTVERIAERVGNCFHIAPRQLQSRRRHPQVLLPRQVGMYLTRRLTNLSLEQIGAYFGGRDHSTVLHACRKIEQALAQDARLCGAVRQLHAEMALAGSGS